MFRLYDGAYVTLYNATNSAVLCLYRNIYYDFCLFQDHFLFQKPTGHLMVNSAAVRDWPDARGIWYVICNAGHRSVCQSIGNQTFMN